MFWSVYLAQGRSERFFGCSTNPEYDLGYYRAHGRDIQLWAVCYPLPISYAVRLKEWLEASDRKSLRAVSQGVKKFLRNCGLPTRCHPERIAEAESALTYSDADILSLLQGRILTGSDIAHSLIGTARVDLALEKAILNHLLSGSVLLHPGVRQKQGGRYECRRCGSTQIIRVSCTVCGYTDCPACEKCANLGLIRGCTPLFAAPGVDGNNWVDPSERPAHLPLTPMQEELVDKLTSFVLGKETTLVVDAVCGSGKGHMIIEAIKGIMSEGFSLPILFVTPRLSVLEEWLESFRHHFGSGNVSAFYGGSHSAHIGPVTIATLPQVHRFYHGFGLVIVDEADAFPLGSDPHYWTAIDRSLLNPGKKLLFTATPDGLPSSLRLAPALQLPARFHGNPLPVPGLEVVPPGSKTMERVEEIVANWLSQSGKMKIFIFVPTKIIGKKVYSYLTKNGFVGIITNLYAGVSGLSHALLNFRQGRTRVVVTTTVLERGITINPCNVVVVWADHPNFTASSLVQMAGRSGRSRDNPEGEVVFLCCSDGGSPQEATRMIVEKNLLAKRMGMLRGYRD